MFKLVKVIPIIVMTFNKFDIFDNFHLSSAYTYRVVNAFRAAGECRRQVKNVTNLVKNVIIVELHDHI